MPSQAARNCCSIKSRLYWYGPGVSLLHHQALLGATLVNGEDQRATWRIGDVESSGPRKKGQHFLTPLESANQKFSSWRINAARLNLYTFFWKVSLGIQTPCPPKLSWRMGFWKKNMAIFPNPWPCSPLFRTLQIAGFAFISIHPEAKAEIHHKRGGGRVSSLPVSVCFFFFASKV